MAYNETLAARLETALRKTKKVETKKMMGGLCFMVAGKMALAVMAEDLLVRVGPEAREKALKKKDCRAEGFRGRPMKAFVFVGPKGTKSDKDLREWVEMALAFNPQAKSSKKSTLKRPLTPMPSKVKAALIDQGLMEAYQARPAYQRNDYLRWITSAKQETTQEKRLSVMLTELKGGKKYMNMAWSGGRTE